MSSLPELYDNRQEQCHISSAGWKDSVNPTVMGLTKLNQESVINEDRKCGRDNITINVRHLLIA